MNSTEKLPMLGGKIRFDITERIIHDKFAEIEHLQGFPMLHGSSGIPKNSFQRVLPCCTHCNEAEYKRGSYWLCLYKKTGGFFICTKEFQK